MSRRRLVAGNWKMYRTPAEAAAAVESFVRLVGSKDNVDVAICPSFLCLPVLHDLLRTTSIRLGAQDVFWKEEGAFTGRISPGMLASQGVSYCIVGHSETRGRFGKLDIEEHLVGYFCETDETVNLKIKALLYHSIIPILCVGETAKEREEGRTDEVIRQQIAGALEGIEPEEVYSLVVAYEPVWAIGTGNTCTSAEADRVCGMIRANLAARLGEDAGEQIRILYGGSVKSSNSDELFRQPNIDGGLVGGASLDPSEFSRIVISG
jgi:triosephosphate isomerase (TIM)